MSVKLTERQQAVVDDRGGSLLVSAAAGSGKTRVLVDRLFSRVLGSERANVDEFLIITYTRAAAAELRERIARELSERLGEDPGNRHLQKQLLLVYQADIKTIDGFCTSLLRENIHLMDFGSERGLTADFGVLDEKEAELLRRRVLPRVLENFYTDMTPGARALADAFGFGRDDRDLEELVLTLHSKIQSHAYPEQWLRQQAQAWLRPIGSVTDTVYGRQLLDVLRQKALACAAILRESIAEMACDEGLKKSYEPRFLIGAEMLETLALAAQAGWDQARALEPEWPRLVAVRNCGAPELKTLLQKRWERCKKDVGAAWAALDVSSADAAEDLQKMAPAMAALLELCEAFSEAYRREKLRRNVTDFSDQEHFAVQLLQHEDGTCTDLAATVASRYVEVMVDEFQDTNQVQNCIFDAITAEKGNLFTVGDVKQSIYRFRLADPTIFLNRYLEYPAEREREGGPRKILLSQNFRSRKGVLDAANFVFRAIMSREMGELDYGEEEQLNFGAAFLPEHSDSSPEFHLLGMPVTFGDPQTSRALVEARFVARRIRDMLDSGYRVTDESTGQLRPCRAEDFAVLMRAPGPRQKHYIRAFAELDIPCGVRESEDLYATMEVAVVYALLQILDNPRQDVPLITALRSPIFGFTPDRLAMIRGAHRDGDFYDAVAASEDADCRLFLEQLTQMRLLAKDMSVFHLIWQLYDRWNILGIFGAMAGGEQRRENLIALCDYARSFESVGYKGLFAFIAHLRMLMENGRQPFAGERGVAHGVTIMTIHKSKGLEFPIVILSDLNKAFNKKDLEPKVLIHPKLGLGPECIDLERHIRYPTAARKAVAAALSRERRAEEMRILYVAMTRAREKLIMVASMPAAQKNLADLTAASARPVPPEIVDGARSMAEWILLPLLRRREGTELRALAGVEEGIYDLTEDTTWLVRYHDAWDYAAPGGRIRREEESGDSQWAAPAEGLDFSYPYAAACAAPSKVTATQLKDRAGDREIAENTAQTYQRARFRRPAFLEGEAGAAPTAAQRGTATHLVMQYLEPDGSAADTVAMLVERRLMTAEQARWVDMEAVERFLTSPLAGRLRAALRVEREYRFSLLVPAGDCFAGMAQEDTVLLQGVVDLFAETEEGLEVVDFKTDRVDAETLAQRVELYTPQVRAYSAALERITGKKVVRRSLYFLRTGQEIEV